MNSTFTARFPKQLGHWAIHGFFNALPSFIIAAFCLNLGNPIAMMAMLSAIGVYVVAFAVVTSLPGPLSEGAHVLGRAIRLGAKIRSWIAGLSIVFSPFGVSAIMFMPDFWCGWGAMIVQDALADWLGYKGSSLLTMENVEQVSSLFLPVFITTMLEGFIISFLLLLISFFCVIFLQSRERRKFFKGIRPETMAFHGTDS
jgi:hypothetical protein